MEIHFFKYQGTGNDFVMVDCISQSFDMNKELIQKLCDRRFGIGADGVICILDHPSLDFEMRYYNSDGSRSFCGNGARCAVAFSHRLGLFEKNARFNAIDGYHEASWDGMKASLLMQDVTFTEQDGAEHVIDTGSPHFISFVANLADQDIVSFGKKIRYDEKYREKGINVNLVEVEHRDAISMLTYERGVEDETFSCGTGATAAALAHLLNTQSNSTSTVQVTVKGGQLSVKATPTIDGFKDIYLIGPATFVFNGTISI